LPSPVNPPFCAPPPGFEDYCFFFPTTKSLQSLLFVNVSYCAPFSLTSTTPPPDVFCVKCRFMFLEPTLFSAGESLFVARLTLELFLQNTAKWKFCFICSGISPCPTLDQLFPSLVSEGRDNPYNIQIFGLTNAHLPGSPFF